MEKLQADLHKIEHDFEKGKMNAFGSNQHEIEALMRDVRVRQMECFHKHMDMEISFFHNIEVEEEAAREKGFCTHLESAFEEAKDHLMQVQAIVSKMEEQVPTNTS